MEKSVHTAEYAALLEMLREARRRAGVTQVELAARLRKSQSFVSKVEVGETRVDVIQPADHPPGPGDQPARVRHQAGRPPVPGLARRT